MSYGMMRGDYGLYRGDPGLFGFIKKVGGGLLSRIIKTSPVGMVGTAVLGAVRGRGASKQRPAWQMRGVGPQGRGPFPGSIAGRKPPISVNGEPKRRRMNVANPKALRRAIRRQSGFVKLAKKALKGSGYTVAPRGAGRRRGPVTVMESGRGGVQVRS